MNVPINALKLLVPVALSLTLAMGSLHQFDEDNSEESSAVETASSSNWAGYSYRNDGTNIHLYFSFWFKIKKNEIKGESFKTLLNYNGPGHCRIKLEGKLENDELEFKDSKIISQVPSFDGRRWLTQRRFRANLRPYGLLIGEYSQGGFHGVFEVVRMDYHVKILRQEIVDKYMRGIILVNDEVIGDVYEHSNRLVKAGKYKGKVWRQTARYPVVQGQGRRLDLKGDFIFGSEKVQGFPNVMIIPFFEYEPGVPDPTDLSGVFAGKATKKAIKEDNGDMKDDSLILAPPVLAALRWHFYGTDKPKLDDQLYKRKEQNSIIEFCDIVQKAKPRPPVNLKMSDLPKPSTKSIGYFED